MSSFKYNNPTPTVGSTKLQKQTKSSRVEKVEEGYTEFSKKTYFAFIDVLGFKSDYYESEIRAEGKPTTKENPSKKYDEIFMKFFNLIEETELCRNGMSHAGQTSDSLFFYTSREDFLANFINLYSYFSVYAMTKDVFFRGGIGCGNLYYRDAYRFYGKSVINAYLLESVIAKDPLIALDKQTYIALTKENILPDFYFDVKSVSGRFYINPFAYFHDEFRASFQTEKIKKEDVLKTIDKKIERFEYEPSTYSKYIELKNHLLK